MTKRVAPPRRPAGLCSPLHQLRKQERRGLSTVLQVHSSPIYSRQQSLQQRYWAVKLRGLELHLPQLKSFNVKEVFFSKYLCPYKAVLLAYRDSVRPSGAWRCWGLDSDELEYWLHTELRGAEKSPPVWERWISQQFEESDEWWGGVEGWVLPNTPLEEKEDNDQKMCLN